VTQSLSEGEKRMTGTMSRKRVVGCGAFWRALGACGGAQDTGRDDQQLLQPSGNPLETYRPKQIFLETRANFELNRKRPARSAEFSRKSAPVSLSEWPTRADHAGFCLSIRIRYPSSRSAARSAISISSLMTMTRLMPAICWRLSYYDQIDEVGRDQGLTFQR